MIDRHLTAVGSIMITAMTLFGPGALRAQTDPSAHQHMLPTTHLHTSMIDVRLPQVVLVREDRKKVQLVAELNDGRPVILNFIFTTCPGICPIMSHTFSHLQDLLHIESTKIHMVSISIDPEQDTPARLRDYATQFAARKQWQYYTGSVEASVAVQQAFGVYGGDKMRHDPVTFMRAAPNSSWIRIDGFGSAEQLAGEFTHLVDTAAASEVATASR